MISDKLVSLLYVFVLIAYLFMIVSMNNGLGKVTDDNNTNVDKVMLSNNK